MRHNRTIASRLSHRAVLAGGTALTLLMFASTAQASCQDLAKFPIKDGMITGTESIAKGAVIAMPGTRGPLLAPRDFCRVAVTLTPTSDSVIKAEVWLPEAADWNGRFLGSGNGGFGGAVAGAVGDMRMGLAKGFATAGDDLGHENTGPVTQVDASWAIGHPEKVKDFAYRADHVTALFAKEIIAAYYGEGPRYSYFRGCSNGGHEALMEAQKFPEDYDGIIAGAPANQWTHLMTGFLWNEVALFSKPESQLPDDKLKIVQSAVLAKCDELDGVKDGIINDPSSCHFDPKVLVCKGGDAPDCLTGAQVDALAKIYSGPVDPSTGASIYPGYAAGSEALPFNWNLWITGPLKAQSQFANQFFGDVVDGNPKWDFKSFDFGKDLQLADAQIGPIVNSDSTDLSAFAQRGGKLILFQGWDDAAVTPYGTIEYYQGIQKTMGDGRASHFVRLFMAPGMMHCAGGPGPNVFDAVTAVEDWREKSMAPETMVAARYADPMAALGGGEQTPLATRPLCAYPLVAHWIGSGSPDDAANYLCRMPR